jgi:hypothetical protein
MRLAVTCNGPGETAGWLRPLLRELYALDPQLDAHVFYVPDDYATGKEPEFVRTLFPQAHAYDPKSYLRIALGAQGDGLPQQVDAVLYLGGDLMHAARLHKRFGGRLACYKFARRKYAGETSRAYAVDSHNVDQIAQAGVATERIEQVGNLAIDGALLEAQMPAEPGSPKDGVLIMPGSRKPEIEQLLPLFFTTALRMRREEPDLPIAFGISPFNDLAQVRGAVMAGGDWRVFAQRGTVIEESGRAYFSTIDGETRFPIVRNALAAAREARIVVTIPGTKVIELAALGKPAISCTPLNAPEYAPINGPLTYLDRIPLIGAPAKRTVAAAYARRFKYHTQPNIDTQSTLVHEMHTVLTPGRIARVTLEHLADADWLSSTSQALEALYREHTGAASRMARSLLALAGNS